MVTRVVAALHGRASRDRGPFQFLQLIGRLFFSLFAMYHFPMANYIIYFNQQWVGDHPAEWYEPRGPLARAVVAEMEEAGVLVFAGGLVEEIEEAFGSDENGVISGPITTNGEFLGGMTIVDVATDEDAKFWGSKIGMACGWPQEIRKFKD